MTTPIPRRPRIAITGMGVVSAIGTGIVAFRDALRTSRCGIAERFPADGGWSTAKYPAQNLHLAAAVTDCEERAAFGSVAAPTLDIFSKFALTAAGQAIADAGADVVAANRDRTAVILGTAVGGDQARDDTSFRVLNRQQAPHPLTIVRVMCNAAVSALSMAHGTRGPAFSVSSACASATHAIGEAARMLQFGLADVAITGGAESLPSYSLFRSWRQMKVLSADGCRPFAHDRNGTVLGEGAGIVVLERLDDALARGARVWAEIAGFGMSADACDWVCPDAAGMARCMTAAMHDAAVTPAEIAYVNAHGTGTARGDAAEADAMRRALGDELPRIPVSSTKALHGHALGASGALELIATVLALSEGWVPAMPPSVPDSALALMIPVPGTALAGTYALTNSFGFGGLNAALVVRRSEH
jgi:nodulation protein E